LRFLAAIQTCAALRPFRTPHSKRPVLSPILAYSRLFSPLTPPEGGGLRLVALRPFCPLRPFATHSTTPFSEALAKLNTKKHKIFTAARPKPGPLNSTEKPHNPERNNRLRPRSSAKVRVRPQKSAFVRLRRKKYFASVTCEPKEFAMNLPNSALRISHSALGTLEGLTHRPNQANLLRQLKL
jgi:hypothetical protein